MSFTSFLFCQRLSPVARLGGYNKIACFYDGTAAIALVALCA